MLAVEARSGFARSVLDPAPGCSRGRGFCFGVQETITPNAYVSRCIRAYMDIECPA
jgi:hypothetical protein